MGVLWAHTCAIGCIGLNAIKGLWRPCMGTKLTRLSLQAEEKAGSLAAAVQAHNVITFEVSGAFSVEGQVQPSCFLSPLPCHLLCAHSKQVMSCVKEASGMRMACPTVVRFTLQC